MKWNDHSNLKGTHAFLSPSNYHRLNYDSEKLMASYGAHLATIEGVKTHEFAALCIERHQELPNKRKTLNMFVNDAIRYNMRPEQPLRYSGNCYGTADAISFDNSLLRVHDLKTGISPASMKQLLMYAAIFCMEYSIHPADIDIELRIYQLNDIIIENPTYEDILPVIDKIIVDDKIISKMKLEEGGK